MLILSAILAQALAAEPKFAQTTNQDPEFEAPTGTLSAELGGALTTGNTDFYNLNSGLSGTRQRENDKLSLVLGAMLGKSMVDADGDGLLSEAERTAGRVETARKLSAEARYDRFFSQKSSLYLLGGALIDPFSGYDLRTHEQFGISRQFIQRERTTLVAELGADYAQEDFVEGIDPGTARIFASRVMVSFHHAFNEHVAFDDQGEVFENVLDTADLRALNKATFTANLSSKLSLKLSHQLTFDNQPVEGFRPLDQTTMVTFVASIY
ncbi:MAG: DUF481 domain-containing protein [Deltaproteobacteria bacterium]|nr:DUF481 domain-containing protein [Deltaproteobacteria bacterium]